MFQHAPSSIPLIIIFFFFTILSPISSDPITVQPFRVKSSPPATIPAFPEQSDFSGCPLDLPEDLFHGIKSACSGKKIHKGRCCPVLGAWLYSAYSTTALSRSISAAARNASSATAEEDMPLLPDDSETCVDGLGKSLRQRGIELARPNETCDVVYCYCGIRLHPLSCSEAFRVDEQGKLVGDERVHRLETDCLSANHNNADRFSPLLACNKCLNSLYKPPPMSTSQIPTQTIPLNTNNDSVFVINMNHVTKLTPTTYIMWSQQVRYHLSGYGLLGHLDGTTVIPEANVTVAEVTKPNPDYVKWQRQDHLISSALIGTITVSLQPVVSRATTANEIWTILASTYAKPSRGHIKQLKAQLKSFTKGTRTIDEYLQGITTRLDQLALLGKPYDHEDAVELILGGLPADYKNVADQIEGKDTPPSLTEIHERLLNHEANLLSALSTTEQTSSFPVSANNVQQRNNNNNRQTSNYNKSTANRPSQFHNQSRNDGQNWSQPQPQNNNNYRGSKPYLGKCQYCYTHGHSARRCPQIQAVTASNQQAPSTPFRPWQPRANMITNTPYTADNWIVDSGATHHITSDLNNLSLHQPYNGGDDVMLADGNNLAISHTGEGSQHGGPVTPRPN